jgi:hypothetical protein
VAESFAKAGHRVVLVRTDGPPTSSGLAMEEGLAETLQHDRLNVLDLLRPTVEPMLCLLPSGEFDEQSRELVVADHVRTAVAPLVEAGNLVVLQAPGTGSVEGEAIVDAADLGLIVVTTRKTRPAEVGQVSSRLGVKKPPLAAIVVGRHDADRRARLAADDSRLGKKSGNKSGNKSVNKSGTAVTQASRTRLRR